MYKIFSVDDHIVEPPELWTSRVPAKHRDRAPHVIEENGRQLWEYEDDRCLTMGLGATAGKPREQWGMDPQRFSDMIPGCYEPKARALDLLSQGVFASVSYPTLPRYAGMLFNGFKDKELASECVRAWNDFVLDEWCPGGPPGMFVPMIICQVWEPALAAKEIERCVAKGAKSVSVPENGVYEGLPSFHGEIGEAWDPIWAICQEADLPISMHIGSGGFMPVADPNAKFTGVVASAEVAGQLAMVNLLLSRVPRVFPGLKFVVGEGGIGWVPSVLQRADRQTDRHSGWAGTLELKPSEVFARNFWVCQVEEPLGMTFHALIGEDKILSELDYPHADTTYPDTQASFTEVMAGIPDRVVQKATHLNAMAVYNWTMADEALYDSPEVAAWRAKLVEDPHAALAHRRELISEGASTANRDPSLCWEWVTRQAHEEPCGLSLGPDGVCPDGHRTLVGATAGGASS
jgi:predicted TIM-barrel fold metal-dependent hydrolase